MEEGGFSLGQVIINGDTHLCDQCLRAGANFEQRSCQGENTMRNPSQQDRDIVNNHNKFCGKPEQILRPVE